MNFHEFATSKPVLYGYIMDNGKQKIGSFKPEWNHNSNSLCYFYYTPHGNKGRGGLTLMRAFQLFTKQRLTTDPENGKPENYL